MTNTTKTPEQKAARWGFWAKIASFAAIGLVAAPIVAMTIYGIAGLIVAGVLAASAIVFAPIVGDILQNWKLKALKAEARRNPVETLQNELLRRTVLLNEKKDSIELFLGKVQTFKSKMEAFSTRYPAERQRFAEQLEQMQKLGQIKKKNWRLAKVELENFAAEIEKAGAIWEMGQCAADTAESCGMSEEEFYAKIKVETSMDAITESMNRAFSQLELEEMESEPLAKSQCVKDLVNESSREAAPVTFRQTIKA